MGDLVALRGVANYPARVKCATLVWHAFLAALDRATVEASAVSRSP